MEVSATLVKELRERSGAGMMECKKALVQSGGDIDAAIDSLRKSGLAKADKKADRVTAEGRVVQAQHGTRTVLVEINCETDFVAKDENFVNYANAVAAVAAREPVSDVEALRLASFDGAESVEQVRQALVAKIGENIQIRRLLVVDSPNTVGSYVHAGRIGVLVEIEGGSDEFAKGAAMTVAAMNPTYLNIDAIPAAIVDREKSIALEQVKDSGKPAEILEKMIGGKVRKTLSEMTLAGQPYAPDQNLSVEQAAAQAKGKLLAFHRLAVGEGIEKKEENFAAEVMKQAGLA